MGAAMRIAVLAISAMLAAPALAGSGYWVDTKTGLPTSQTDIKHDFKACEEIVNALSGCPSVDASPDVPPPSAEALVCHHKTFSTERQMRDFIFAGLTECMADYQHPFVTEPAP
jgi:hypothetical protein